jgi:probable phosphoglycerate mutase
MVRLALLRHGATDWTARRLLQGRSDPPLSPAGRAQVQGWRLPPAFASFQPFTSPLRRCHETACLLLGEAAADRLTIEPRLVEMSFGAWEGRSLARIRHHDPAGVAALEARGLDFRAPGGESPREVQERLSPWLLELAEAGRDTLAVTHKGVIRAVYALAYHWDMIAPAPVRTRDGVLELLTLEPRGALRLSPAGQIPLA